MNGMWQTTSTCPNQTCVDGVCSGVCAPGQTNPVACGKCGTDTQTCDATGNWQSGSCNGTGACTPQATMQCNMYGTETCSSSCAWGACSCGPMPACTPGAHQCSGNGVQTCDTCGQWGSPVSCGTGMTCTGGGSCVPAATDCPGNFLLCDGFESGSIDTTTKWESPRCSTNNSIAVSSSQHHTGSYSLQITMASVPDESYVNCLLQTAQSSIFSATPMYFRAWVYMTAFANTDNEFLVTPVANGSGASGGMGINKSGDFVAGIANSGDDYENTGANPPILLNTWTCIEVEVDTDYSTYPNGKQWAYDTTSGTPDPNLVGDAKLQPLGYADFGVTYNGPAQATTFYFDDIAISNTYIACDQ